MSKRIVGQIVDVPVQQILHQIVDVPVPQIMEETVEETVNVPVPQIQEQIVEEVKALLIAVHLSSSFSPAFFVSERVQAMLLFGKHVHKNNAYLKHFAVCWSCLPRCFRHDLCRNNCRLHSGGCAAAHHVLDLCARALAARCHSRRTAVVATLC